jgi:hypothetical protein
MSNTKPKRSGLEDNGVGKLRQQSALCDAERRVVLVSDDPQVRKLIQSLGLEVVRFYPDTTDEFGSFAEGTFKIQIQAK